MMTVPDVSRKITPIASTVLGFKNGGNTLIAVSPKGTKARDAARVGLGIVGNAPAPGVPGCWAPFGKFPGEGPATIINPEKF